MQRYFADIKDNLVILSKDDEHHVLHVMRNKLNDEIEVIFNSSLYLAKFTCFTPLRIEVIKKIEEKNNNSNITLYFALAKGDKNELVIQKATELGVKNIVLVDLKRCVSKLDQADYLKKEIRYKKIIKEASEQSHRLEMPNIYGVYKINEIPKELLCKNLYVAYEKELGNTSNFYKELNDLDSSAEVGIIIGPEGGFEEKEIKELNDLGFKNVSLGNRILRTETAAIYAISVIGFMLER